MIKLSLHYEWQREPGDATVIDAVLFQVLYAIHETGSIAAAARTIDMSYRYVWGLASKWEQRLGTPLVSLRKGRGAQLTDLGRKLLWAHELVQARLAPDLEGVRAEIERALSPPGEEGVPRLEVCASHDLALARLREHLASRPGLKLDLRFQGSVESLRALAREQCVLAGFHVAEGLADTAAPFRSLLDPRRHRVIGLATRVQGLMLARGNPWHVASVADLARPGMRIVNRQPGSGSRIELDHLLVAAGIDPPALVGYQHEEFTHLAVAATVAGGGADAGFGIEAAAAEYALDYLPLLTERYYLACRRDALDTAGLVELLRLLRGPDFDAILAGLPGYGSAITGEVLEVGDALYSRPAPSALPGGSHRATREPQI